MRIIKFEICIRRKDGSDLYFEHPTLGELLNGDFYYNPKLYEVTYIREFTGLRDKNGKEIYEGDIIKVDEILWQVYFGHNNFSRVDWIGWSIKKIGVNRSYWLDNSILNGKIIGDIYENPELIK